MEGLWNDGGSKFQLTAKHDMTSE